MAGLVRDPTLVSNPLFPVSVSSPDDYHPGCGLQSSYLSESVIHVG